MLKRSFDIFLRFYTPESFRDFLAFRAIYPSTLEPFFKHFFKQRIKMNNAEQPITDEIIESAKIYGQSLNRAAYIAASEEVKSAEKSIKKSMNEEDKEQLLRELKHRKLMQLESMIMANQEDERILDLLSRLGRMVARETLFDIDGAADIFIKATLKNEISSKDAKSLILIYMRLRPNSKAAKNQAVGVLEYQDDIEIEDETQTEQ